MRFDGQVVIVTGAARGIGREYALLLGARGATVVVNDVSQSHSDRTVADIVAAGGIAHAHIGSVADPEAAMCGAVVTGSIKPHQCPLFCNGCTPETPIGALMVSSEGACSAAYQYGNIH